MFLLAFGCAPTSTVTAHVVRPAQVPVRSFPRVWIAARHSPEAHMADALARHLAGGDGVEVRRVDVEDLEPARRADRIPVATAVVLLEMSFEREVRTEWTTRPSTVCGSYGCSTVPRSYPYDVPILRGLLEVRVYDGPSAEVLQEVVLEETDRGRTDAALRRRVSDALLRRLLAMVDQRFEQVRVVLLDVELDGVDGVVDVIRQGDWHGGRVRLEKLATTQEADRLDPEQRARLLYVLGQARRFDPAVLEDPHRQLLLAEEALRRARELDDRPLYRRALEDLARHREEVLVVLRQRAAAERNERQARSARSAAPSVPEPPPSYAPSRER